jgi:hypothetical protein
MFPAQVIIVLGSTFLGDGSFSMPDGLDFSHLGEPFFF